MDMQVSNNSAKNKFNLSLNLRVVVVILLAVVAGMLAIWKPWDSAPNNDRVIEVTGDATIKAEPDEYVFYPNYQFKNSDKDVALKAATKQSETIVSKLNELGLSDSQIKTNTSGYDYGYYYDPDTKQATYTLSIEVTVTAKDMAQKVQDYLVSTEPTGAVSPQANFSEAKRKGLESEARDKATKEARAKAEQSAKNLGFKLGKVKSVNDSGGFFPYPIYRGGIDTLESEDKNSQLAVQPGENELNYSVTVVYYLR